MALHSVPRPQHRHGAQWVLLAWREWAELPWSLAGAALPSLGPRWRCVHSISPAPAGLPPPSAPDPWSGKMLLCPPASSAWQPLGPVQLLSLLTGIPLAEPYHHGGASGWASSSSPKYEGEGGIHVCPLSDPGSPMGSGAQGGGEGIVPGTHPSCCPLPSCSKAPSHVPQSQSCHLQSSRDQDRIYQPLFIAQMGDGDQERDGGRTLSRAPHKSGGSWGRT